MPVFSLSDDSATALQERAAPMARFLELRGRRIARAAGALWYGVNGRILMSLPYQAVLDPDPAELDRMLVRMGYLGARFPSTTWGGGEGGLYTCFQKDFGLHSIHHKMRSNVRRGLERCEIRVVEPGLLLTEGRRLNLDTMARQDRYDPEFGDPGKWRRFVAAMEQVREVEALGAFIENRLAAYVVLWHDRDWIHILHQMSLRSLQEHCPNHALDFQVTRTLVSRPGIQAVNFGLAGLVSTPALHAYKLRMGYTLTPRFSACHLHPAARMVMTSLPVMKAFGTARRLWPRNQTLERAETLLKAARESRGHARGVAQECGKEA